MSSDRGPALAREKREMTEKKKEGHAPSVRVALGSGSCSRGRGSRHSKKQKEGEERKKEDRGGAQRTEHYTRIALEEPA